MCPKLQIPHQKGRDAKKIKIDESSATFVGPSFTGRHHGIRRCEQATLAVEESEGAEPFGESIYGDKNI
jgi:hypothetical protein